MNRLWPKRIAADHAAWKALLEQQGIRTEDNVDATYGIYEGAKLIATGSRFQNILKCIAVDQEYQGGAVFNELISELINEVYRQGYDSCFLYTKPQSAQAFTYLGFVEIERVEDKLCFMERATRGFSHFLEQLKKETEAQSDTHSIPHADHVEADSIQADPINGTKPHRISAIVMNANPFTKGHLKLVETAAAASAELHIFVLSEDLSAFPNRVRKRLVQEGTAHISGVHVHDTRGYMVSAATFPSYFLKEDDDVTSIQATLDARIFKYKIAPVLNIDTRFVGEEPFSRATNLYNEAMQSVFASEPQAGIPELIVIPRLEANDRAISATDVRRKFATGDFHGLEDLLPPTTLSYLLSDEGMALREKLKSDPGLVTKDSDQE